MSDVQAPEADETQEVDGKIPCPECGKPFAPGRSLDGHIRMKHPIGAAEVEPAPERKRGRPLKLPGLHRAAGPELDRTVRDHKLLRPQCGICAPEVEAAGYGWWLRCPHDPYVGEKGFPVTDIEYDDEHDEAGNVIGRVVREGYPKTRHVLRPWPNIVGVAQMPRLNSGRGVYWKTLLYGFIEPEDLVSPAFPDGVAPMCEFYNCFWQNELQRYGDTGTFCQEAEAIGVYESLNGTPVEVNNQEVRDDQLAVSRMKMLRGA